MYLLQNCAVVMLLMIVTSNAAIIREDKATEMERSDHQVDKYLAEQAFIALSTPCSQDGVIQMCAGGKNFGANDMIDMILDFSRRVIIKKNIDRMDLPPFEAAGINVEGGWLEKTSSIARKGPSTVNVAGTSVLLYSTVGLNVMQLQMNYTASSEGNTTSGSVQADVKNNSVSFSGGLEFTKGKCRVFLQTFKITDLSDITFNDTTSGSPPSNPTPQNVFLDNLDKIKETVGNKIRDILKNELKNLECPVLF